MRAPVLCLCLAVALPLAAGPAHADPVYFGAATRGGVPADVVTRFRASLLEAFNKKRVKVLDATSGADDTAARQQAEAKAALDEATASYNEEAWADALTSTEHALTAFELGPAFVDDDAAWALYRDILSLRALTYLKLKKKRDADAALRQLLIVLPRYAPSRERAPPELSRHVDDVKDELRSLPPAAIEIHSKPGGAKVIVDGKRRGRAPVVVDDLAPGVHYVVVEGTAGRYSERVQLGDGGARVEAKLGSKKGAAAHDVVGALSKPTTAKAFVQMITDVDDDVIVAVILPAGKKFEVVGARVVDGEVKTVCGVRSGNTDNDRDRATFVLAEGLLEKSKDTWLDQAKGDDVNTLRPELFSGLGVPPTDVPDEEPPAASPAAIAAGIVGVAVALAVVGTTVGIFVARELKKNDGFTFNVDTTGL